MRKEFAERTLKRLDEMAERRAKLLALGINMEDFEDGANLLEEAIALLFAKDDKDCDFCLNKVLDWLKPGKARMPASEFVQCLETGDFGSGGVMPSKRQKVLFSEEQQQSGTEQTGG